MSNHTNTATSCGITITNDNSKKFASRLKKTLKKENIDFKMTKCYDILAEIFGSSNWHELSQHLKQQDDTNLISNIDFISNENHADLSHLNSVFDLPWLEFKYFVEKLCISINMRDEAREIILIILEILKDRNQQKSYLNKDALLKMLDIQCFDLDKWLTLKMPLDYYDNLQKLPDDIRESINSKILPFYNLNNNKLILLQPLVPLIRNFFHFIKLLTVTNILLYKKDLKIINSEYIDYDSKSYSSVYPFISILMNIVDNINNKHESISFHDILIFLYLKPNKIISCEINNYQQELSTFLLYHTDYSLHLLEILRKSYVYNDINIISVEKQNNLEINIKYHLNYISIIEIMDYLSPVLNQLEKTSPHSKASLFKEKHHLHIDFILNHKHDKHYNYKSNFSKLNNETPTDLLLKLFDKIETKINAINSSIGHDIILHTNITYQ